MSGSDIHRFETEGSEQSLINKGMHYFYNFRYSDAIKVFQNILSYKPNSIDARIRLGMCYLAIGDYDFAEKEFSLAQKLNSEKPELIFSLGNLHFKKGNYIQAIDYYDELINFYPNFERAFYNKALALLKSGSVGGVDKLLMDAILLNHDDYMYHFALASILSFNGLFSEAVIEYQISANLNNEFIPIKINTGFNYIGLKMYDLALQMFEQVKNNDLYTSDSYFGIGLIYYELHHYKLAVDNLSIAINLNPNDARSYILRSSAYSELGELKLALDDYKKVLSIAPECLKRYFQSNQKKQFLLTIQDYFKYIDIYLDDNKSFIVFL